MASLKCCLSSWGKDAAVIPIRTKNSRVFTIHLSVGNLLEANGGPVILFSGKIVLFLLDCHSMATPPSEIPTDTSFSFVQAEKKVLEYWEEEDIFKKSLENTRQGRPYIFYDGPPFATGLPHHGNLVGSVLKDVVPRYWTMKGRWVERRFGWDCHGLPIEHEINKKLNMPAAEAVKKLGVAGYNDECRAIVGRYVLEWQKTIKRIGRWVDFENDYKTMDASFMESVWWVFKELWDKNLIYQSTRVVPFSTALGTVLSNFEAGQNYREVQEEAITVLFKLKEEDAFIAAWTTTPWTLPSNLALCVNADVNYSLLEVEGKKIYLSDEAVTRYFKSEKLKILQKIKGRELTGRRYHSLFSYFAHLEKEGAFAVLCDDYVTTDAGTGIVHLAPGFGEDDNRVMKEAGLGKLMVCPVDDSGNFTKEISDLSGTYVKDADKVIVEKLKRQNLILKRESIVHSYPFCYRSDTPLIYKSIPSWYVRVEEIKDRLLSSNSHINWIPDHIKDGRFGKWLEGARDWSISRNRVWGTPLPVWQNQATGEFLCIGSLKELEKYSGVKVTDLHRQFVDPLIFTVKGVEGEYKRIAEVLDCWFESGSMPYAQLHYPFENQKIFKQGFPAEFIAEGLDQTRGWFYTLTILSTALFDKPAFKNVIVNGIVMAKDGKKMSKRLKNYTPPDQLMEMHGADAMRLYLINSGLVKAEEMRFADEGVKDMVRRVLLPWYNSFKFFHTYARLDGWSWHKHQRESQNIMDNWIISHLQTLKKNIAREMENYHLYKVVPALFDFVENLTNCYIRFNRSRFWISELSDDKKAAYSTLYTCLREVSIALAPFAPFLSEHIYRALNFFADGEQKENQSVHLCSYPEAIEAKIDQVLEAAVSRMQKIILLGRQKRMEEKIKVKIPLAKLTCIHRDHSLLQEIKKLDNYIKLELNVKEIDYDVEEDKYIALYARPNFPLLGKRLGKKMKEYRGLIENLSREQILQSEAKEKIELAGESFNFEEILILRQSKADSGVLCDRHIAIALDCQLTPELMEEGMAREVVSYIQRTRKESGFNIEDRIKITYSSSKELGQAILKHREYISTETLALSIVESKGDKFPHHFKINDQSLKFSIKKA